MEITVDIVASLKRAKELILAPKEFFSTIKKEKGWKKAFSFTVVVALLGHILTATYNLLVLSNTPDSPFKPQDVLVAIVVSFVLTLAMSFIWGGALKVWLSVFKVEATFEQSYRVMAYSRTPNYLFSWVPYLNLLAALYSFYLMMLGLENEFQIPRRKAIVIIVASLVILLLISFLIISLVPRV